MLNEGEGAKSPTSPFQAQAKEALDCAESDFTDFSIWLEDSKTSSWHLSTTESLFDLASLTKVLVTLPLVSRYLEKESLSFDSPVGSLFCPVLPLLENDPIQRVTFRDILSHRGGFPAWRSFWMRRQMSSQNFISRAERWNLLSQEWQPQLLGQKLYSDLGYMFLGLLLELKTGETLSDLFAALLNDLDSSFSWRLGFSERLKSKSESFVVTSFCPIRNKFLVGDVHDENAWAFGGNAGHAGLFGDARSVVHFLKVFYNTKTGQKILGDCKKQLRLPQDGEIFLGWHLAVLEPSRICLRHYGFTGTAIWTDFDAKKILVFLSNRVFTRRLSPSSLDQRRALFRRLFWNS